MPQHVPSSMNVVQSAALRLLATYLNQRSSSTHRGVSAVVRRVAMWAPRPEGCRIAHA
jgi:hypothetical protein